MVLVDTLVLRRVETGSAYISANKKARRRYRALPACESFRKQEPPGNIDALKNNV